MILPFVLRRSPILVSILDPFMVGGYGAPKLALAPLFILWFGIGTESKIALVASVLFFIIYFSTLTGVRALDAKLRADGADHGRQRAAGRAQDRAARRRAQHLRGVPHRLCPTPSARPSSPS